MTLATKLAGLKAILQFNNRWQLLLNRGLFREPLNMYRLRDVEFIEDHRLGDANGARAVLTSRMYTRFLDCFRKDDRSRQKPWRVADFGASNGGFPLLLHLSGFVMELIVAVEMNPRIFPRLRFNLEHNVAAFSMRGCVPEIEVYNVAIGATRRIIEVPTFDGTGGSIYASSERDNKGSIGVPAKWAAIEVWRPEDVLKNRTFDLIKIDIEGAEHEIFASRSHLCLRQSRWVIMEIHSQYGRAENIFSAMERLGFTPLSAVNDFADSIGVYCFKKTDEGVMLTIRIRNISRHWLGWRRNCFPEQERCPKTSFG